MLGMIKLEKLFPITQLLQLVIYANATGVVGAMSLCIYQSIDRSIERLIDLNMLLLKSFISALCLLLLCVRVLCFFLSFLFSAAAAV